MSGPSSPTWEDDVQELPHAQVRRLTWIAWVATLLVSRLPEIVLRELFALSVPWMAWVVVAMSAALWVGARAVAALRPLERYFAILTVLALMLAVIPEVLGSAAWQSLVPSTGHPMVILLAERVLLAALAIVMIGVLFVLGTRPSDAYLVRGDLNAPTSSRTPRSTERLRWRTFGPIMVVFLLLITAYVAAPAIPAQVDLPAALPFIGIGAIAALLNAFWEEVAFRAAPLSQLRRAVGPTMGVAILAAWFGLGHFYGGIPSGLMGSLVALAVAFLFGRAMVETRGLGWPLALHFATDLTIYTFLALAATAPVAG